MAEIKATTEQAIAWFENRVKTTPMPGARSMFEMALSALRAQKDQESNEPLTLDELRNMKDEPVYIVVFDIPSNSGWLIIKKVTSDKIIYRGWQCVYTTIDGIGVDYNLYRHKPEKDEP